MVFDLNKIKHIDNVHNYSEEELFKLVFSGDRYIHYPRKANKWFLFSNYVDSNNNSLFFYYQKGFIRRICSVDVNENFHNEDNVPSDLEFFTNGNWYGCDYYKHGVPHNPLGPARIKYCYSFAGKGYSIKGKFVEDIEYIVNGMLHNSIGHAVYVPLSRFGVGSYHICGRKVNTDRFLEMLEKRLGIV